MIITHVNGALGDEPEEEEDNEHTAGQKASAVEAGEHLRALEWYCENRKACKVQCFTS